MAPPRRITQSRGPTPLPPYEPPYIPLSISQLQQLGNIADGAGRQTGVDKLVKSLAETVGTLGSAAADLGELVPIGKDDHDKEQAEKQVLLDQLEEMARGLVDASHKAKDMKVVLSSVVTSFRDKGREARRRQRDGEENELDATKIAGEGEGVLGEYEGGLRMKLRDYGNLSMTAKYGEVAEYVEFRRFLWNAQHPDQRNNLPKPSTWFSHLEGGRRKSQAHQDDDEDSDIEIAQEKQSYNCPLTLKRFEHPVTSTICPHSFEKAAVEDYLRTSGGSGHCPVPGCPQQLTLAKLRPDPVLERDVRRAVQRAQRRQEEEEEEDNTMMDEEGEEDEEVDVDDLSQKKTQFVKNERGFKRPGRGRAKVLDIDSEGEDED